LEVVRSHDILEKQILEDARKKAKKILDNAKKELEQIKDETEKSLKEEIKRLEETHEREIKKMEAELKASVPLEMMRIKLKFIQDTLDEKLDQFFTEMKEGDFKIILEKYLARAKDALKKKHISCFYYGLKKESVESSIRKIFADSVLEELREDASVSGMILLTGDKRIKVKCTVEQLKAELFLSFREEMFKALFRDKLPDYREKRRAPEKAPNKDAQ
jgi:V/A-type H+-transporting ATPase subunit E